MDLRSISLNYDQKMNWLYGGVQGKVDVCSANRMMASVLKEKAAPSMNREMVMNLPVPRTTSHEVQTDPERHIQRHMSRGGKHDHSGQTQRELVSRKDFSSQFGSSPKVEKGQGGSLQLGGESLAQHHHHHNHHHPPHLPPGVPQFKEDAIVPYRPSIGPIPDYDRSFVPRFPIEEHHLAQINHHHHPHQVKGEPNNGPGPPGVPPYYGETDFDTNYYSKLMSAFLIQDCNSLRSFKEQAGSAYFNGGPDVIGANAGTDGRSRPSVPPGFDMRGAPAYPFYNDPTAAGIFSPGNVSNAGNGGSSGINGHNNGTNNNNNLNHNGNIVGMPMSASSLLATTNAVNRKPNAVIRLGGEEVTCDTCGKKFPHIWLLKIHSTIHSGRELKTCDVCNRAFVSAFGSLRRHQQYRQHHHASASVSSPASSSMSLSPSSASSSPVSSVVSPSPVMPTTGSTAGSAPSLIANGGGVGGVSAAISAADSSPPPYPCDLCGRMVTPSVNGIDNGSGFGSGHHRSRTEKAYPCEVCNRSYSTLGNLKQHKEKHYGEKAYVCDKCNKSFYTSGNLKQHTMTHTGEKAFLCKLCQRTYSTSGNLKQHMLTHTGQKFNFCVICNRSFSTLGNLKQHMLTHFGANLYPCEVCKKSYSTLGNLKQHMLTHTGQKLFPCGKCEKTFTTLGNAKQHMLRHTGEKPYDCQICGKSFFTLGNLKQHALTHSDEKLYSCDKCTKSFYTLSNLKQHALTHSDQKKSFLCEICNRAFSTFGNLKQHKLKHS